MPIEPVNADLSGLPADVRLALAGAEAETDAFRALSDAERDRLERLVHPDRRRSFALGRLAARTLIADMLGSEPAAVPLGIAAGGAPEVTGEGLFVSIAHAGRGDGVAAVAAVAGRPVGVDLELAVPRHRELLARLLTAEEGRLPQSLEVAPDEQPSLVWTLKEAVLKGIGTGLRRGARSVVLEARAAGLAVAFDGAAAWSVRYERTGSFWLAVAWRDG